MSTSSTGFGQLSEGALSNIFSNLSLAEQTRVSQVSSKAKEVFQGSLHRETNGYSLKEYRYIIFPDGSRFSHEDLKHPELSGNRMVSCCNDNNAGPLFSDSHYSSKETGGIRVERAPNDDTQLTITAFQKQRSLTMEPGEVIYDFSIQKSNNVIAVATSKGLKIYAIDSTSAYVDKISEFSRFRFHSLLFSDKGSIIIGIEPHEKLFHYSWNTICLNFSAADRTTHCLDNPLLNAIKEGARKVGLFALRLLVYFSIAVAIAAAITLVIATIITVVHVAVPLMAGVTAGAMFLKGCVIGGMVGVGAVLPIGTIIAAIKAGRITFGKPILDRNFF